MVKPPTPYFAFVEMSVNSHYLTPIPPEHLIDFSYNNTIDIYTKNMGNGSVVLFDQTAIDVEFAIHDTPTYPPQISFRFGYSETDIFSETYTLSVQSYDFELKPGGATISLTLVAGISAQPIAYAANTNANNIKTSDEIFAEVIEKDKQFIINTKNKGERAVGIPYKGDDANGNEIDSHPPIYVKNDDALKAVGNSLLEASKTKKDKESNFVVHISDVGFGRKISMVTREEQVEDKTPIRDYTYPFAKDGSDEAISFTAKVDTGMMLTGGGTVGILAFDEETNEPIIEEQNAETNTQKRLVAGEETFLPKEGATRLLNASSGNIDVLKSKANFLWGRSVRSEVKATLVVLGDPYIDVFELVNINALTPSGIPHHTSGVYQVMSITHNISGGTWVTSLDLWRQDVKGITTQPGRLIKGYHDGSGGKNPFNPHGENPYGK